MLKGYKYRIYPTVQQQILIDKTIGICRFIYNLALETKINAWQSARKNLSAYDLFNQLPELKEANPWMKEVDSQALQYAIRQMDSAYKNFFKGAGFPKYKSKHKSRLSFHAPNHKRKVNWENLTITIPKIENIPAALDRQFKGQVKDVTISKTSTGKYFASVLVDTMDVPTKPTAPKTAIGIDLGITSFTAFSTGHKEPNPKHLKRLLERLKVLQQRASRKKKGSNNRKKANL